jgi:hypothetical protein
VSTSGQQGNDWSTRPTISADGRYVAFTSFASNLIVGDTNAIWDVFVRDQLLGTTKRVSEGVGSIQANNSSDTPSISADGNHIAFHTDATNICANSTSSGVALRDQTSTSVILASVTAAGVGVHGLNQSISADGLFVVFESSATNIVVGDTNGVTDIFLREAPFCLSTPIAPHLVTATPSTVCAGTAVTLTADGSGAQLNWYLDALGGTPVASGSPAQVLAPASAGSHTYFARWESADCIPSSPLGAVISVNALPPNDDCGMASAVGAGNTSFDTTCATDSANVNCGATRDLWYVFTPTTCGTLVASVTTQAGFSTAVGIFRGTACNSLALMTCGAANASVPVQVGPDSYWIRVGSTDGSGGPGVLSISETSSVPANDDCVNASMIADNVPTSFSTSCASTDGGAHVGCSSSGQQIDHDVWFRYVSTIDGMLRVSTCGTATFDTRLAVYRDDPCPVSGASLLACGDDTPGCGVTTTLMLSIAQGQSYLIRVGGDPLGVGTGTLLATGTPAPPCPPSFAATSVKLYQVTGAPAAIPWSWRLHATDGSFQDLSDLNVPGVPANLTTLDIALAFAASINQAVAAHGCNSSQLNAMGTTILGQVVLSITYRKAALATNLDLYVGPGGGPPVCAVGTQLPACTFNPTIELLLLPGEDCNGNGIDDFLDIITGTSMDVDGNGIPDECAIAPGASYCEGDGSSKNCPCGNNSIYGDHAGCANSTGQGARLSATGEASLAHDTLVLHGAGMPNSPVLYFQGFSMNTLTFGDGFLCAGGIRRLGAKLNSLGSSSFPEVGGPQISVKGGINAAGTTGYYQAWYRDPATYCTGATFNLSNGMKIVWMP